MSNGCVASWWSRGSSWTSSLTQAGLAAYWANAWSAKADNQFERLRRVGQRTTASHHPSPPRTAAPAPWGT